MNYCYILANRHDNKTYVGYTNHPLRRIRQHNGELVGGAKYTTRCKGVTWYFLALVTTHHNMEEFTKNVALSLEWHIKYEYRSPKYGVRRNGPIGRVHALINTLTLHPKFKDFHFNVYLEPSYHNHLPTLPSERVEITAVFSSVIELRKDLETPIDDGNIKAEDVHSHIHQIE